MKMMSWCAEGRHELCRRTYQRFLIDPKTNTVIWLDDWRVCECKNRKCECYTKPADRTKKTKTRKRKT